MHYNHVQSIRQFYPIDLHHTKTYNQRPIFCKTIPSLINRKDSMRFDQRTPTNVKQPDQQMGGINMQSQSTSIENMQKQKQKYFKMDKKQPIFSNRFESHKNLKPQLILPYRDHIHHPTRPKPLQSPTQVTLIRNIESINLNLINGKQKAKESSSIPISKGIYRSQAYHSQLLPIIKLCEQQQIIQPYHDTIHVNQQGKDTLNIYQVNNQKDSVIRLEKGNKSHNDFRQRTSSFLKKNSGFCQEQITKITKLPASFCKTCGIKDTACQQSPCQMRTEINNLYKFELDKQNEKIFKNKTDFENSNKNPASAIQEYIQLINKKNRLIVQQEAQIVVLKQKCKQNQHLVQQLRLKISDFECNKKEQTEETNDIILNLRKQVQLLQIKHHQSFQNLQQNLSKSNAENSYLLTINNSLQKEIVTLKSHLQRYKQNQKIQEETYSQLDSTLTHKTDKIIELEKALKKSIQQNNKLRNKIPEMIHCNNNYLKNSNSKNYELSAPYTNMSLQNNMKFRDDSNLKNQEIQILQNTNRGLGSLDKILKKDNQIQKLQIKTDFRSLQMTFLQEQQLKTNQISNLNRIIKNLQQKSNLIINNNLSKGDLLMRCSKDRSNTSENKLKVSDSFDKLQKSQTNVKAEKFQQELRIKADVQIKRENLSKMS